jgi:parallel beta-helix repeat protein
MAQRMYPVTALIIMVILGICGTVQAEVIYVDAVALGIDDGSSWTDAYNNLQDALAVAVAGDEIRVAQGTYKPDQGAAVTPGDREATFQLISGVTVNGGYAGDGEPDPDARDISLYETILSGDLDGDDGAGFTNNAENSYHVVTGSAADATAVLDGLTITAGNANGADTLGYGSGLYNDLGSPSLTDCTLTGNWATSDRGGGMYNGNNSSPTLTNCSFVDNWPDGMDNYDSSPTLTYCTFSTNFKGMHNLNSSPTLNNCTFSNNDRGMYNYESSTTLTNCTFTQNSEGNYGGAMYNLNSNPILTDCTFTANSADYGGGVYNESSNTSLTNCTFIGNSADSGGAIYNYNSNPTLTGCAFTDNSAQNHSGAIRNFNSNALLTNCTFIENEASTDGGAIGNSQSSPTLTGCTFTENYAGNHGGAVFNNAGTPVLTECTFTDNTAFAGAGIANQNSNAIITDCTFTLNASEEYGAAINNNDSSPQITRCMFFRNLAGDFGGGAVCNWSGSPTIRNCLFSTNVSIERGGAVMNNRSSLILFNCTFVLNTAGAGNAVGFYSYQGDTPSSMQATNCIFWDGGDEISDSGEGEWQPSTISITYSDIQGGWDGDGNIDADPLFVDVGMDDCRLLAVSPCIDAGDPAYVPVPDETDLDGNPRVVNGRIDMGAYEQSPSIISVDVGVSPSTINLKSQGKYITVLLTFSEGVNVADVDTGSILLQDSIQPLQDWAWLDEQDRLVMVRYSREDVQAILNPGNVDVKITGSFYDGTPFEGTGVVKVINKGGGKKT